MVRRFARLLVTAMLACALIGVGFSQGMPAAHAAVVGMAQPTPCGAFADAAHHAVPGKPAMPAGHATPACMSDLGCLLVVGIPAMPTRLSRHIAWSPVVYWASTRTGRGVTSVPILGPPIRHA